MYRKNTRPDYTGPLARAFKKNRMRIMHTQDTCAICGRYVDKAIKYPDPMCATVDHIIPLNKGGHPSDIDNLQLTHMVCNQMKSDKMIGVKPIEHLKEQSKKIYQTRDWKNF